MGFGETEKALRLPIETFGYQYATGGFHPVLSGFLLQFLALAIIAAIPQASPEVRQRLEFLLGLSVPLALCRSAGIFPLQAGLVAAWAIFDRRSSGEWHLVHIAVGTGIGVLLLLPFLAGLAAASGYMQLRWPLLVLALAVVFSGLSGSLAGMLAALFVALLVFAEIASASDGIFLSDHIEMVRLDLHRRRLLALSPAAGERKPGGARDRGLGAGADFGLRRRRRPLLRLPLA